MAAPSRETETELQVVARGQLALLPKLRIPPPVECKLLIKQHLSVKSGGVRKVKGIEAGERELPLH